MADLTNEYFAQVKLDGVKEPINIPKLPLTKLFLRVISELSQPNIRIRGNFTIHLSKFSIESKSDLDDFLSGLDLSNVELMTPEAEAEFAASPWNTDPLYVEYMTHSATQLGWDSLSPEQQRHLRSHMDRNYSLSPHWNGIHKF